MKFKIGIFVLLLALISCNDNHTNTVNISMDQDNNDCSATLNVHTETYLSPGQHNPVVAYVSIFYPDGSLRGIEQITDVNGNLNASLDCAEPIGYYRIEAKTYNGIYIWQFGWRYIYFSGKPETFPVNIILEHVSVGQ